MNTNLTNNRATLGPARNGDVAAAGASRHPRSQNLVFPGSLASTGEHRPGPAHGGRTKKRRTHWALGVWLLGVFACITLALGCSKNSADGIRLEGVVTLDGSPITKGSLQFIPPQPSKKGPVTVPIKDGRYVATAIPLGKVRVLVGATKETGRMIKEYSTPRPEIVSIIPEKYRDGIEIEVTGDKAEHNIELTSR